MMESFLVWLLLKALTLMAMAGLGYLVVRVVDRVMFPGLDFEEELKDSNGAVAIVIGATVLGWFIALGLILG